MDTVDNIDVNPSSRDSRESLHGTAITLTQLPTVITPGRSKESSEYRHEVFDEDNIKMEILTLPDFYTHIALSVLPQVVATLALNADIHCFVPTVVEHQDCESENKKSGDEEN